MRKRFLVGCAHPFAAYHAFKFASRKDAVRWAFQLLKRGWEIIYIEDMDEWEVVE